MASKESLENLLGSFTIFFDKPFTVGDIVTLGGVTGVVEKVGFRSTRIRTFDKSIVTVPNKNIISTELDNLGARPVRRVKFNIGHTYDTSVENIKKIVNKLNPEALIVIVAPLFKIPKVMDTKIKAKINISGANE